MKKAMDIFLAFMVIFLIAFFAVGFVSGVDAPTAGTSARYQYDNLTQTAELTGTGINGAMLILMIAMLFAALFFLYSSVKRRA